MELWILLLKTQKAIGPTAHAWSCMTSLVLDLGNTCLFLFHLVYFSSCVSFHVKQHSLCSSHFNLRSAKFWPAERSNFQQPKALDRDFG